jgi:hypothetical protein
MPQILCLEMLLLPSLFLIFPFSDAASLISSLESQLANSVSADAAELLKQEHAAELQGLRAQAARAQGLETELMKTREAESSLRLEFDRWLTEEREILSAKHNSEVDELRTSLEGKVEVRDAKIIELETLRALDSKRHDDDLSAWRAWDRKLHSSLLGLEEALHGRLPLLLPNLCFFKLFLISWPLSQGPSPTLTRPQQPRWRSTEPSRRLSPAATPRLNLPPKS